MLNRSQDKRQNSSGFLVRLQDMEPVGSINRRVTPKQQQKP
jgi:hypothetical protein